jgi:hypothetical protein
MKAVSKFIFLLLLSSTSLVSAKVASGEDFEKVNKEINKTLSEIVLDEKLSGDIKFKITLTVNGDNQIVVSEVSSHSNTLKRNVKAALNNKQLRKDDLIIGKEYIFEISIKTEG